MIEVLVSILIFIVLIMMLFDIVLSCVCRNFVGSMCILCILWVFCVVSVVRIVILYLLFVVIDLRFVWMLVLFEGLLFVMLRIWGMELVDYWCWNVVVVVVGLVVVYNVEMMVRFVVLVLCRFLVLLMLMFLIVMYGSGV